MNSRKSSDPAEGTASSSRGRKAAEGSRSAGLRLQRSLLLAMPLLGFVPSLLWWAFVSADGDFRIAFSSALVLALVPYAIFVRFRVRRPVLATGFYLGGMTLRLLWLLPLAYLAQSLEGVLIPYLACIGLFLFFEVVSQALFQISGRT